MLKKQQLLKFLNQAIEYCFYGLIFFIPTSKAAIEIFASLAILFFILKKIIQPDFKFMQNKTHLFLLLFFMFSGFSLVNSGAYLKESVMALISKWLEYILIFIIAEDTLYEDKIIRNCLFILLGLAFFIGIDAVSQRFFGIEFFRYRKMVKVTGNFLGVTGPFRHYNSFGAYLVIVLIIAITRFISAQKKLHKIFLFILVLLLGLSLTLTFSRGSWLGFSIGLVLMLILLRKFRVLFFIIFLSVALLSLPDIRVRILFTFQKGGDAARFALWQAAWRMIQERPFLGKGLGTFMTHLSNYTHGLNIQYAHNSFLQILAETGLFSLLSFLLFIFSILCKAFKEYRRSFDILLLGFFSAVIGFLIHAFFDTHLYSLQLSVLFWCLLGILAARIQLSIKHE